MSSLTANINEGILDKNINNNVYTLKVITSENSWLEDGEQQIHSMPFVGTHLVLLL